MSKIKVTVSLLLAILGFGFSVNAYAETIFVPCPLDKARTEMISPLKGGWWQTPQVGSLEGVRTQVIGGEPTLVCLYRAYGNVVPVMRLYPKGMDCRPKRDGFQCSSTDSQNRSSSGNEKSAFKGKSKSIKLKPGETYNAGPINVNTNYKDDKIKKKSEYTKNTTKLSKSLSCPDPVVVELSMPRNWISFSGDGNTGYFRLVATVQNQSSKSYISGDNQQFIKIHEVFAKDRRIERRVVAFKKLVPKEIITAHYAVVWPMSRRPEYAPRYYEASITYDPDIMTDGNKRNDDCNTKNNSKKLQASYIETTLNNAHTELRGKFK